MQLEKVKTRPPLRPIPANVAIAEHRPVGILKIPEHLLVNHPKIQELKREIGKLKRAAADAKVKDQEAVALAAEHTRRIDALVAQQQTTIAERDAALARAATLQRLIEQIFEDYEADVLELQIQVHKLVIHNNIMTVCFLLAIILHMNADGGALAGPCSGNGDKLGVPTLPAAGTTHAFARADICRRSSAAVRRISDTTSVRRGPLRRCLR